MNEILSQSEIDNLLSAVEMDDMGAGSAGAEAPAGADDFAMADAGAETMKKAQSVKMYDFKRPDKFSKEQIRTIQMMHETYARLTTTSLSGQLRSYVNVHVASVDQLTYEEFSRSIPNPTTLAIVNMDPLRGSAIMEIDPTITFAIIDRLFGGEGVPLKDNRELSEIEVSVIEGIIIRILGNLRESWSTVIDLRPKLSNIETNIQFAQIVPPNDMVVLVTLETRIGDVEGMTNFCIPYITIESIISKLSAQYLYSAIRKGGDTENLELIKKQIVDVRMDLVANLGHTRLSVNEILKLKKGDILPLDTTVHTPLELSIMNKHKFDCRAGRSGNKLAVQVTKIRGDQSDAAAPQGETNG
ncbi:MAG: flagellar motor switch protein FliM [Spirochaetes bacterium]|nr:flagellar motor switch protein FliM [Spirochaetota bacterium]